MTSIRYKHRGNKWYVYEISYYWDNDLKRSGQTSRYLGNTDPKSGGYAKTGKQIVSKTKLEQAIVDFWHSFAINEVCKAIGLDKVLADSFGDFGDSSINLAYFQITEGSAMQAGEDWYEGNIANILFKRTKVSSQDISRLIKHLGKQELHHRFFKNYIERFFPNRTGLVIDSTALPSAINAYGTKDINMMIKNNIEDTRTEQQLAELAHKLQYSGTLILLSKSAIKKQEILPTYYLRQAIAPMFGFAKANTNILPLRVCSELAINGYLMLVFVSLILFISVRAQRKSIMCMAQALMRLRGLPAKIYANAVVVQEPNKKINNIAKLLEIILPTAIGI